MIPTVHSTTSQASKQFSLPGMPFSDILVDLYSEAASSKILELTSESNIPGFSRLGRKDYNIINWQENIN